MRRQNSFLISALLCLWLTPVLLGDGDSDLPVIPHLLVSPTFSVSTIPSNGDLNPYGVAFVPPGFPNDGLLRPGDVLVSNFNASSNLQGTGTTIVRISPDGTQSLFFQDGVHLHGPLGLVRAPNGDLITAQGDAVNPDPAQPNEIVEYTSTGRFVAQFSIDSSPGAAFGLGLEPLEDGFRFAAVDDALNVLDIWVVR